MNAFPEGKLPLNAYKLLSAELKFAVLLLRDVGIHTSTVISSISIMSALDIILLGAKEDTAKEIRDALNGDFLSTQTPCLGLNAFLRMDG